MNSRLMIVVAILPLTASNSPPTGRFGGPPSPPRYDQRISPSCVYEVFSVPSRRPAVVARTGSQAIASIDVYGATSNRAAIIDFDSGPEFSLQVREVEEQIRIVISRLDRATGQFQQACEIQVKSRDERLIDNLRVSMAAAGPQRWRIRVFDPNTDGDTGMPPSLWLSEAGSLFACARDRPPS
jgi:hypothetical protein